jgi:outer membrane protein assembly factor BamB
VAGFDGLMGDYYEGSSTVQAYRHADGTSAWNASVPAIGTFRSPLTIAGGVFYSVDDSGTTMSALAAANGSPLWHWQAASRGIGSPPLMIASDAGHAYLVQPMTISPFAAR